jgi:rare lipoprotein A
MIVTGTAPVIVDSTNNYLPLGPVSTPIPVPLPAPTPTPTPLPAPAPAVAPQPQIRQETAPYPVQVYVAPQPAEPAPQIPPAYQVSPIAEPAKAAEPAPAVSAYRYAANIIGGIPQAGTGKHYRLQVGAYRIPRNAVDTFERLKDAGLNPAYEINGDIYRVVLAWLDPKDIPSIAEKLYYAGFSEAVIREER